MSQAPPGECDPFRSVAPASAPCEVRVSAGACPETPEGVSASGLRTVWFGTTLSKVSSVAAAFRRPISALSRHLRAAENGHVQIEPPHRIGEVAKRHHSESNPVSQRPTGRDAQTGCSRQAVDAGKGERGGQETGSQARDLSADAQDPGL